MRAHTGLPLLAALAAASLPLAGCDDCGDYTYRDVTADEWCGTAYGTSGILYDAPDDSDGSGVFELTFAMDAPPEGFTFYHHGQMQAWVLADELSDGLTFTEATPRVLCGWTDLGDPAAAGDEVTHTGVPAESYELTYEGWRLPLGDGPTRAFAWDITCGPYRLTGADSVEFQTSPSRAGVYDALATTGVLDVPSSR